MADYYEVLGVPRGATAPEVRRAYLRLARERHPDRFADHVEKERAQEFFKDLTTAFNTLSNERARQEYDAALARPRAVSPEELAREALAHGARLLEERDFDGAAEQLRAAVHYAPDDARAHALLGRALARRPQGAREATQSLEKATQLAPQNPAFFAELAVLLQAQGLKIRARRAAEAALRLAPQSPEIRKIVAELGAAADQDGSARDGGLGGLLRRKP